LDKSIFTTAQPINQSTIPAAFFAGFRVLRVSFLLEDNLG
jgi:hypothetical protein